MKRIALLLLGLTIGALPLSVTAVSNPGQVAARQRVTIWSQPAGVVDSIPRRFAENYAANLSPRYQFLWCDELAGERISWFGLHLLVTAPLAVVGLLVTVTRARRERWSRLLAVWFLLYPVPAAICADWNPHPFRTVCGMPLYPLLCAAAWSWVSERFDERRLRIAAIAGAMALALNIGFVVDRYVRAVCPSLEPGYQTGLVRAFQFISPRLRDADFVLVSSQFTQPYVYALLYAPIAPAEWHTAEVLTGDDRFGFHHVARVGKFYFAPPRPERTPDLARSFAAALDALPRDAVGYVIEIAGHFPAGEVVATFDRGRDANAWPPVEVRRWRFSDAGSQSSR